MKPLDFSVTELFPDSFLNDFFFKLQASTQVIDSPLFITLFTISQGL